jgi:hypothetical protein
MASDTALCNLVFPIQQEEVLLALGLVGFNKGYRAGYGGKVELGESRELAAEREFQEESTARVKLTRSMLAARITFISQGEVKGFRNPATKRICDIYLVRNWIGIPRTTKTMADPQFYGFDALPWDIMPEDYQPWLLDVLRGQRFEQELYMQGSSKQLSMIGKRRELSYL